MKELSERVGRVTEIIKGAEMTAGEIVDALEGNTVMKFTFTRPNKTLIVNGVRESPDSARLSGDKAVPCQCLSFGRARRGPTVSGQRRYTLASQKGIVHDRKMVRERKLCRESIAQKWS